jgi:recombination protein RecT
MSEPTSTPAPASQVAVKETTTLAKKEPTTLRGWIESPDFQNQIAKALPTHLTPDRQIRIALTALTRTPKLMECTPASVCKCLLDLSAMGLEPDGRRAHLIPYGKECQLIVDYKGLAELAMRSGTVSNIHADVVCENDFFEADTGRVRHRVNYREPRGKAYAAYCLIRFKDESEKAEVMSTEEIEAIRKRSRAGASGPWVTDWNEMAKKTVARRTFKWVPLSPEIRDAVEKDADVIDIPAQPVARKEPINPFEAPAIKDSETPAE